MLSIGCDGAALEPLPPAGLHAGGSPTFAIEDGDLFWLDTAEQELLTHSTDTGLTWPLARVTSVFRADIAVGGGTVFWQQQYSFGQQSLTAASLAVGAPYLVGGRYLRLQEFVADARGVYGTVLGSAGGTTDLVELTPPAFSIRIVATLDWSEVLQALDDAYVYGTTCTATLGGPSVWRLSRSGGAREVVATDGFCPTEVRVDATGVYFLDHEPEAPGVRGIYRAGGPDSPSTLVVETDGPYAIDGTHVYSSFRGTIVAAPIGGGLGHRRCRSRRMTTDGGRCA